VEAAEYGRTIRQIVRYLDVCDGNLEEGSMRCDCNVSVRKIGTEKLGTKVEIKNVNSFRFVEKAIEYEIERQIEVIERGDRIIQETRLWDPDKNRTLSMRTKEDAQEYRYFPDPDLLPLIVSNEMIELYQKELPELPIARAKRFQADHNLPESDALVLTSEKSMADYYEETSVISKNFKASSNWVMTELMRELNNEKKMISESPISPQQLGRLILLIDSGSISGKIAKVVFQEMWLTGNDPELVIKEKGLVQITDPGAIEKIVVEILAANQQTVEDHRSGKKKNLMGFFVGAVLKASKGQANPEIVNRILQEKLR
jgi:aspartyl-tRNA(Asn)/glutamyl-tRNA(Gln) amidotransferase subunit B